MGEEVTLYSLSQQLKGMMAMMAVNQGNQEGMQKHIGNLGNKIDDVVASSSKKFEALEKRMDAATLAINEIKNVKGVRLGGVRARRSPLGGTTTTTWGRKQWGK